MNAKQPGHLSKKSFLVSGCSDWAPYWISAFNKKINKKTKTTNCGRQVNFSRKSQNFFQNWLQQSFFPFVKTGRWNGPGRLKEFFISIMGAWLSPVHLIGHLPCLLIEKSFLCSIFLRNNCLKSSDKNLQSHSLINFDYLKLLHQTKYLLIYSFPGFPYRHMKIKKPQVHKKIFVIENECKTPMGCLPFVF